MTWIWKPTSKAVLYVPLSVIFYLIYNWDSTTNVPYVKSEARSASIGGSKRERPLISQGGTSVHTSAHSSESSASPRSLAAAWLPLAVPLCPTLQVFSLGSNSECRALLRFIPPRLCESASSLVSESGDAFVTRLKKARFLSCAATYSSRLYLEGLEGLLAFVSLTSAAY